MRGVLIVPSGIETQALSDFSVPRSTVLIVPSGIETSKEHPGHGSDDVLIVPSGIETVPCRCYGTVLGVLIVPSGIETSFMYACKLLQIRY